jgi:hypothetical protein
VHLTESQYLKGIESKITMHNLKSNIQRISEVIKSVLEKDLDRYDNFEAYKNKPKATDLEILAMAITQEALGIASENDFYNRLSSEHPEFFKCLPDRSNYNRRKNRLRFRIDFCSVLIKDELTKNSDTFIIDSMPLPVCRNARAPRLKIMNETRDFRPVRGYMPIDKAYYCGFKLHLLCSKNGVIVDYNITQANVHDVDLLKELSSSIPDGKNLLGDKGYVQKDVQLDLFEKRKIAVFTPNRKNSKRPENWNNKFKKQRKRIETLFSQLCDQMRIKQVYSKSVNGFLTRVISKIAAVTILQYLNKSNDRSLNLLKDALAH